MGELSRMTQYKDKIAKLTQQNQTVKIPTSLFMYPVLMAADIALYNSDYVIVGVDQKQHVEFARDIIERFNKKYKPIFNIPEPIIAKQGAKIMDLLNPEIKMSKSNKNENGTIFLNDDPEVAKQKIMHAKTDSLNLIKFDMQKQPGIANLITIYHCLTNTPVNEIEEKYEGCSYNQFKTDVASVVSSFLVDFHKKFQKHVGDKKIILDKLAKNADACLALTKKRMLKTYQALGVK